MKKIKETALHFKSRLNLHIQQQNHNKKSSHILVGNKQNKKKIPQNSTAWIFIINTNSEETFIPGGIQCLQYIVL